MKIFLVYDKIQPKKQPSKNGNEDKLDCTFANDLAFHGIKTQIIDINKVLSYIKLQAIFVYPLDIVNRSLFNSLQSIPTSTLAVLNKYQIPIIALAYDNVNTILDDIPKETLHKFYNVDIYFITSNLKIYNMDNNSLRIFKKIYTVNYWESTTRIIGNNWNYRDIAPPTESIDVSKKHKDFLCFNRNLRPHRLALVSEFSRQNLFENSIYTIAGSTDYQINKNVVHTAKTFLEIDNHYFLEKFSQEWSPKFLPYENASTVNTFKPDPKPYEETFYSVVTETEIRNDVLMVSEKPFKSITFKHPFIFYGSPGLLTWFKDNGYETFPEFFNESYDQEPDPCKRMSMIIKEVVKFKNLTLEQKKSKFVSILPKLEHNYNHWWFGNNIFKSEITGIFFDIYNNWRSVGVSIP